MQVTPYTKIHIVHLKKQQQRDYMDFPVWIFSYWVSCS